MVVCHTSVGWFVSCMQTPMQININLNRYKILSVAVAAVKVYFFKSRRLNNFYSSVNN